MGTPLSLLRLLLAHVVQRANRLRSAAQRQLLVRGARVDKRAHNADQRCNDAGGSEVRLCRLVVERQVAHERQRLLTQ